MSKNCGTCISRVRYVCGPDHYICKEAKKMKRVTSKHKICSKYKKV